MINIESIINKAIAKAKFKFFIILLKYIIPVLCVIELFLIITLIILTFVTKDSSIDGENKIDADDLGKGTTIPLPVQMIEPIEGVNGSKTQSWYDTGLIVVSKNDGMGAGVSLSVGNVWYPLGKSNISKECELELCSVSDDPRCKILKNSSVSVVASYGANKYCKLSDGKGIYLLFAKPLGNGNYNNPNANYSSAAYPTARMSFYTSHLGEFKMEGSTLFVDKAWSCDGFSGACDAVDMESLLGSRIYIKLLDDFYGDNVTKKNNTIKVNIKGGVYKPNFIQAVIKTLESTLDIVSSGLKNSILYSIQNIISATLILYLSFNGLGFALGMINISYTEFIVRIFKLSIVVMLTTPNDVLTDLFLSFFKILGETSANLIASVLPDLSGTKEAGNLGNLSYLLPYEDLVNQLISYPIHIKILSLALTKHFYLIPFLYLIVLVLLLTILKALLLFITAYMQIAVLVIILPIMALTILFQITGELFQNWMRYMANSAMLITVTVLATGLILSMISDGLANLLNYQVELGWIWAPVGDQASKTLTIDNVFFVLLKSLIAYTVIDFIPGLVDGFTNAQFSPSANSFRAMQQGIGSLGGQIWDSVRGFNAEYGVGRLLDQAYKKDGKYSQDKEGTRFFDQFYANKKAFDHMKSNFKESIRDIQNLAQDNSILSFQNDAARINREKELMQIELNIAQYENKFKDKVYDYVTGNIHSLEVMQNGHKILLNADALSEQTVRINNKEYLTADLYDAISRGNSTVGDATIVNSLYKDPTDATNSLAKPADPTIQKIFDLQRKLKSIKTKI